MTGESDGLDEELDLGPRLRSWPGVLGRIGWRWRAGTAVVVVAAVAIPLIVTSHHHAPSTTTLPGTPTPVSLPKQPTFAKPTVRRTRPFVLGIHRRWELFGRSGDSVVRIQFARGRVTTTPVPPLQSTGPVFFVVGPHVALVRPLDFVPGYLVPDGRHAQIPTHSLNCGGPALPGPRPDTVWVARCARSSHRLYLTLFDGTRTGVSVVVPGGNSPIEALPGGQGDLLFPGSTIGSVESFDVRPGRASSTVDRVVAVGPTRWLVQLCSSNGRCRGDAIIDRTNGKHRRISDRFAAGDVPGVISPDGSKAAMPIPAPDASMVFVDLATGAFHGLLINPSVAEQQTMAWSPDSRWLFVLARDGSLYAVDGRTGLVVTNLSATLHLPSLDQLAIRPAPSK